MKNAFNNHMNFNNFGLRSYSYLKNSFKKLNNAPKALSPRSEKSQTQKSMLSSLKNIIPNNSINTNPFNPIINNNQQNNQAGEIFPNDSFGDSKKNISDVDIHNSKINSVIPEISQTDVIPLSIDPRIEYVLKCLDLTSINDIFELNKMSFNDMLFLSRDDYNDLGFTMIQRNRLIRFCEGFQEFAKDYSYEEVVLFFKKNKNYLIKDIEKEGYNTQSNSFLNNNFNSVYPSSRNGILALEKENMRMTPGNRYNNEVFMPERIEAKKNREILAQPIDSMRSNSPPQDNESRFRENKTNSCIKHINNSGSSSPSKQNQIQHTELQFSSSMSSINYGYKSPKPVRNNTPSAILSSYQRINKEIDEYMLHCSNKKNLNNDRPNRIPYILNSKNQSNRNTPNNERFHTVFQMDKGKIIDKPLKQDYYNLSGNNKPNSGKREERKIEHIGSTDNIHKLNRNDSLTDLHKTSKNLSSVDMLTECLRKKDNLLSSLNHCNSRINESRKLLRLLEDS